MEKIYYFFHHGILFLGYLLACLAMTTTNITTDQSSLLTLISHITPDEILAKNWSVNSSVCDWVGVTCGSRHHRVTALNISNMGLTGTIPPQLGNLSFLVSLDMSRNNFRGELPPELANLHRLRTLNFSVNNLSGVLPSCLGWLQKLQILYLRYNNFTGPIPFSISNISDLEILSLSNNFLEGRFPIEIGNLHKLKQLGIGNNKLSGFLPSVIFNVSSLEVIALAGNSLSGSLPVCMCDHLQRLNWLTLFDNKLQGQIPSTLSNCSQLQVLGLNGNDFSGFIPREIGDLKMLEQLFLDYSNLNGPIPKSIGNLTMLKQLNIAYSKITGKIPEELGNLYMLERLRLEDNFLSGVIPFGIFNLSMITDLGLGNNNLTGNLASRFGHKLINLENLNVYANELYGVISASISNASKLQSLALSRNKFSGPIPKTLGDLRLLRRLALHYNNFTSEPLSTGLDFITSLTNCRYLEMLEFSSNPLRGILPISFGNLSTSVKYISAFECEIKGNIPDGLGNLTNLLILVLPNNLLTGPIPTTFKNFQNLQGLYLQNNQLNGPIPEILCDLKNLYFLSLGQNQFSGSIPSCIGNATSLGYLSIPQNLLNSSIPTSLWNLTRVLELDLSSNFLSGPLPQEVQNLKAMTNLDLSMNHISGNIPSPIGDLGNLIALSLAHNGLDGHIPDSLGQMLSLKFLDMAHNDLSGAIPKSFEALSDLKYLNLSFNNLSGEIPSHGPFKNFTSQSFLSNGVLCGSPRFYVPPCSPSPNHRSSGKKNFQVKYIFLGVAAALIAITLAILSMIRHKRKKKAPAAIVLSPLIVPERISYYELLQATNGYNESNLLGTGSIGSVYKGTLTNGILVAVKVFNLQMEITHKSFISECEVLRSLRHRNLTKVVSVCSNDDFKALVLEYMPNGSLEKWLYSHNHYLDLKQRISIMVDVACALEYLHHGYTITVVHCDLKPANILLDEDMVAHLGDFGLAKLLDEEQSGLHTKTLATLGYIAPEYGLEGLVSTRSDVYSFGIVLMETFSRMKPSDEFFSEDLNLKSWIEDSIGGATIQVIDANLLKPEDIHLTKKLEYISLILELALSCCKECPADRMSMKDVVVALIKIKHQVLSIFGDQI